MKKTAMVTAGGSHTGLEIAKKFASEGYDLIITSRDTNKSQNAVDEIQKKYPDTKVFSVQIELTSVKSIKTAFSKIKKEFKAIDVFVANAAHLGVDLDIYNTTEDDFDAVFNTNVKGTFFCCQEAARLMKNGGAIVTLGSVQSKGAVEGRTVYGASKAALSALTKYLAYDLATLSIRANCVVSGAIHTSRWDNLDPKDLEKRRENYLTGRESTTEEVANAVYYLASPLSSSVTGTEIVVDSGLLTSILPYANRKVKNHDDFLCKE